MLQQHKSKEVPQAPVQNDKTISYHNISNSILGCSHYRVNCKIKSPCCGKLFPCRFCHDENSDHQIDRHASKAMMCMYCFEIQPIQATCASNKCQQRKLAHYYCDICKFFDDDSTKEIFHCAKCGICRRGRAEDYYHCDKCNSTCLNKLMVMDHKCLDRATESNCPICYQFMFGSTTVTTFLKCGHALHLPCATKYLETNYTCPLCQKSAVDTTEQFQMIDTYVFINPVPEEFKDFKAKLLCNDCGKMEIVPYHFYLKCPNCSGYNTVLIDKIVPQK